MAAKFCGDNVDGQDVACACGDIVVSSVVLAGDPCVAGQCDGDALVVRATHPETPMTVDLNGKTLRGGKKGTAIWVVDGGEGGARIVSSGGRASIVGFRDGVVGRGPRGVSLVENVDVRDCGRDGLRLDGVEYEVRAVEVTGAGRDGISLDGRGYRCDATRSLRSRRFGYFIDGSNAIIGKPQAGNSAEDGGNDGFHMMGSGLRLNVCTATGNRKDGITLRGGGTRDHRLHARNNGQDGMSGDGGGLSLLWQRRGRQWRNGIAVTGVRLVDGGGNHGSGNRGTVSSDRPSSAKSAANPASREVIDADPRADSRLRDFARPHPGRRADGVGAHRLHRGADHRAGLGLSQRHGAVLDHQIVHRRHRLHPRLRQPSRDVDRHGTLDIDSGAVHLLAGSLTIARAAFIDGRGLGTVRRPTSAA